VVGGFLVIDKPAGISSHDVVNRVRRALGTKKVGHTGTLDPFATGVLPIAVGEGTKAIQFLDEGEKEYEAVICLGVATDTLDHTGTTLATADPSRVGREQLVESMKVLTGVITQLPPMFSAIKQGGQPLYKLARKGIDVERSTRQVTIYSFELLSFENPLARVRVRCSRGTYVRTLADDLGRLLGCGACLAELRRTMSGPFSLSSALTLDQLAECSLSGAPEFVTPFAALGYLPQLALSDQDFQRVRNGRLPQLLVTDSHHGLVRLVYAGQLVAVAEQSADRVINLKRVFN
jgi:tRNA pseudouridine55 synthase